MIYVHVVVQSSCFFNIVQIGNQITVRFEERKKKNLEKEVEFTRIAQWK